ncbi:TPA: anti sigma factor C-terminal domain-containing protein [Streptococcus suis]
METFELLAKKTRCRLTKKIWLISFIVILGSFTALYYGCKSLATYHRDQLQDHIYQLSHIAYPNIHFDLWSTNAISPFSGTFRANRFKDLAGVKVPYEPFEGAYSVTQHTIDLAGEEIFNQSGYSETFGLRQKFPQFFSLDSELVPHQDLSYTGQMEGQLIEVAITFDKGYTFDEIQEKIPANLSINWYWIGPFSNYDTWVKPSVLYGIKSRQRVWFDEDEQNGFRLEYEQFYHHLQETDLKKYFAEEGIEEEVAKFLEENKDGRQARFAGVLLTGNAEDFAQLEGQDWIYASSIGATVPNQPYYQLNR